MASRKPKTTAQVTAEVVKEVADRQEQAEKDSAQPTCNCNAQPAAAHRHTSKGIELG